MTRKQFPSFVKKHRDALGISQEQFAQRLGVSWLTVWRWETGRAMPRIDAIGYWVEKVEGLK